MRVFKWGDSLAVRLPSVAVEALALKPGDEVGFHLADNGSLGVARKPDRQDPLDCLQNLRDRPPADVCVDRQQANGR